MPNKGKAAIGTNAVAGIGMASVIHQKAIKKATAKTLYASGERAAGLGRSKIIINKGKPEYNPIFCLKEKYPVLSFMTGY